MFGLQDSDLGRAGYELAVLISEPRARKAGRIDLVDWCQFFEGEPDRSLDDGWPEHIVRQCRNHFGVDRVDASQEPICTDASPRFQ
jgi:hypothetical protein